MSYSESDYLLVSGIQHYIFCKRQWALIHIEQAWAENRLTAEGQGIHHNAHNDKFVEKRPGILITRRLRVSSAELGISGECDVVEFTASDTGTVLYGHKGLWQPVPVEYKHGKAKNDISDVAQLCCEAMCLEEMLGCEIPYGDLYYYETRSRMHVDLTPTIRDEVRMILQEMRTLYERGHTPKVKPGKKCKSCSIKDFCLPQLCKKISAEEYINHALRGDD